MRVRFVAYQWTLQSEQLFVVGSNRRLGDWNPARAQLLTRTADHPGRSQVEVYFDGDEIDLEYKYVLLDSNIPGYVKWENGPNRRAKLRPSARAESGVGVGGAARRRAATRGDAGGSSDGADAAEQRVELEGYSFEHGDGGWVPYEREEDIVVVLEESEDDLITSASAEDEGDANFGGVESDRRAHSESGAPSDGDVGDSAASKAETAAAVAVGGESEQECDRALKSAWRDGSAPSADLLSASGGRGGDEGRAMPTAATSVDYAPMWRNAPRLDGAEAAAASGERRTNGDGWRRADGMATAGGGREERSDVCGSGRSRGAATAPPSTAAGEWSSATSRWPPVPSLRLSSNSAPSSPPELAPPLSSSAHPEARTRVPLMHRTRSFGADDSIRPIPRRMSEVTLQGSPLYRTRTMSLWLLWRKGGGGAPGGGGGTVGAKPCSSGGGTPPSTKATTTIATAAADAGDISLTDAVERPDAAAAAAAAAAADGT